jgi:hypothetical protein
MHDGYLSSRPSKANKTQLEPKAESVTEADGLWSLQSFVFNHQFGRCDEFFYSLQRKIDIIN